MDRKTNRSPIALPDVSGAPEEIRHGVTLFGARAAALLQAAGLVDFSGEPGLIFSADREQARRAAAELAAVIQARGGIGTAEVCFLRVLTADGLKLCENLRSQEIWQIEDACGLAAEALDVLALAALRRGNIVQLCPSPLLPTQLEAVVLPEAGMAFCSGRIAAAAEQVLALDQIIEPERRAALRQEHTWDAQMQSALLARAARQVQMAEILAAAAE